jgi:uncharacterized protein (DUF2147 family)
MGSGKVTDPDKHKFFYAKQTVSALSGELIETIAQQW